MCRRGVFFNAAKEIFLRKWEKKGKKYSRVLSCNWKKSDKVFPAWECIPENCHLPDEWIKITFPRPPATFFLNPFPIFRPNAHIINSGKSEGTFVVILLHFQSSFVICCHFFELTFSPEKKKKLCPPLKFFHFPGLYQDFYNNCTLADFYTKGKEYFCYRSLKNR